MRTPRALLVMLGCAALAVAAVQGLTGMQELVFYAGPFLLLLGLLLSGRFIGEAAILARRRAPPRLRPRPGAGRRCANARSSRSSSAARGSSAAHRPSRSTSPAPSPVHVKEVPVRTLACTVAAAALLLAAPVALAHQGNPNYRSVVKSVTPQTSGIDARIINFDDAVLVHNTSGKDVVILDYKEQPYVELKADGTVNVNTNSEAYYLNEDRQGETDVPKGLGTEPKWEEVSKSGRYEWHDHRMHWMGAGDPPNLTDKGKETVIYDNWSSRSRSPGATGEISRHADLGAARRRRAADGRDLRLRRADHRALDRGHHRPPPARVGRG